MSENFKGLKVEAKGLKGFDRKPWQKSFKSNEHLNKWVDDNDAELHGTRDTDAYHYHKKAEEARMAGRGSHDPIYENSKKNK